MLGFTMVAAACSGETTSNDDDAGIEVTTDEQVDDGATDDPGADDPETAGDSGADDPGEAAGDDPGAEAMEPIFAEDPYGGIFADFQASYDRGTDPFSSLDTFCAAHDAAEGRTESMPGITADTIQIGHLRSTLEELANIGFGVEVGEPAKMFEAFVEIINSECGGIRGRQLLLETAESSPLAPDTTAALTAACLRLTEDVNSVVVLNSTGFQGPAVFCVIEEHETSLITTQGLPDEFYDRGNGLLTTTDPAQSEALINLVIKADADGLLDGRTIGVVYPDTPGVGDDMQLAADKLRELGYDVVAEDEIGCDGGTSCAGGVQDSVARMKSEGVDALFPGLNILSLPLYISEMVTQGFEPGDVQFFNSSLNSQNGDLVSSKVAAFGGEAAAQLYNGTYIVDGSYTGFYQTEEAFAPPFNQMCLDAYASQGGPAYDFFDPAENTPSGMVSTVCSQMRTMARILYHAGDNPTTDSIREATANLGPIDVNAMLPSTVDGVTGMVDVVQSLTWTFPCEFGPDGAFDAANTCIVPNHDWVTVERVD